MCTCMCVCMYVKARRWHWPCSTISTWFLFKFWIVCVCACMCTCAHVWVQTYMHHCTCVAIRGRPWVWIHAFYLVWGRSSCCAPLYTSSQLFTEPLEVSISVSYFGIEITNASYRIWFYMSYEAIGPHACIVSPHPIHPAYFFLTQAFWLKLDLHITLAGQPSLGIPLPQPFIERIPAVCLFTQFSSYFRALNLVSVLSCLVL